jgi:hypothetical protein
MVDSTSMLYVRYDRLDTALQSTPFQPTRLHHVELQYRRGTRTIAKKER